MSKSNALETQLLEKIFNNTNFPWDANTVLYVSLHTADPGEAGSQTTNETAYAGYSRVGVARTSGGWQVLNDTAQNVASVSFPQCSSGSATITHVAVGTQASGAGVLLYSGALASSLIVSTNITPSFAANTLQIVEE